MRNIIIALALLFTSLVSQPTFAMTSNGSDGAFVLDGFMSLSVTNQQIFNYTTFDLRPGSILEFNGIGTGDEVTILSLGDINLDGTLILSGNLSIWSASQIFFNGEIWLNGHNLSLYSNVVGFTGELDTAGGTLCVASFCDIDKRPAVTPVIGRGIFEIPTGGGFVTEAPEPKIYSLLMLGFLSFAFFKRTLEHS